jgi:hypothetical protein
MLIFAGVVVAFFLTTNFVYAVRYTASQHSPSSDQEYSLSSVLVEAQYNHHSMNVLLGHACQAQV